MLTLGFGALGFGDLGRRPRGPGPRRPGPRPGPRHRPRFRRGGGFFPRYYQTEVYPVEVPVAMPACVQRPAPLPYCPGTWVWTAADTVCCQ